MLSKVKNFTTYFILFLFLFVTQICKSQNVLLESINRVSMPAYVHAYPELEQLKIPTPYNEAIFEEDLKKTNLLEIEILAWDLVFTRHPIGVNHDNLNERRLQWLYKKLPAAFNLSSMNTRVVEQTKGTRKEAAAKLYHGFIVYYKKKPDSKHTSEELTFIKKVLIGDSAIVATKLKNENPFNIPKPYVKGTLKIKPTKTLPCGEVTYFYTCNTPEMKLLFKQKFSSIETLTLYDLMQRSLLFNRSEYANCDSIIIGYNCNTKDTLVKFIEDSPVDLDLYAKPKTGKAPNLYLKDSTVLRSFDRTKWNDAVICTDVTGSMSPYSSQLLLWIRDQNKSTSKNVFYFFNDGDNKKDNDKVIGRTGGIYKAASPSFVDIANSMGQAMRRGTGGDYPENNLECLIKAQTENPVAKEIIMIADNWTSVKDMALLPQIKVPIRIILCGNIFALQLDYLNIAYKTGGSLHTLETDIVKLEKYKEGDELEYHKRKYKVVNGLFTLLPVEKKK